MDARRAPCATPGRARTPARDTSRVGTGRESGTLGDPRAPHVAAGESRRDRRGTPASDARRARTPHAALALPAAARQSRVVLSLHARVWLALQPPAIARSLQNFHLNHFRLIARSTIGTAAATTLRSGFSDRATPSMVTIVLIRSVEEGGT